MFGLEKLLNEVKKTAVAASMLLATALGAQTHDSTYVKWIGGVPGNTISARTLDAANDSITDTTYRVPFDSFGEAEFDSLALGPNNISIKEYLTNNTRVFPTVVQNYARVEYNREALDGVKGQLFNTGGQLVQKFSDKDGRFDLNMSNLPTGAYLLNLETDGGNLVYKLIKTHYGENPRESTQNWGKKVASSSGASSSWRFRTKTPDGYTNLFLDTTLSAKSYVLNVMDLVDEWDTIKGSGQVGLINGTFPNFIQNMDVTFTPVQMDDVLDTTKFVGNSGNNGTVNYSLTAKIDSTANMIPGVASYKLSTPEMINPDLDSSSATNPGGFERWLPFDTIVNISTGINSNILLTPPRKPIDPAVDHSYVLFHVQELDPNLNASLPTNAIAVLTDTATGSKDTIFVDPTTGWGMSSTALPGGTFYHVDIGVPGGVGANGHHLKSYDNIPLTIDRKNYFDIANQDSTNLAIMVQLYPDSINTKNHGTVGFSAAEIDEFYKQTNIQLALQDSLAYHVNNALSQSAKTNIGYAMDSINTNTSIITSEVTNTIPNANPYNPQTATFSSHGINFIPGNGSYITTSGLPMPTTYGLGSATAGGIADISLSMSTILKEYFRGIGEKDIASRPSVLNGTSIMPTAKDWASVNFMYSFSKAVHKDETQNVHPKYFSDNTQIGN